MRCPQCDQELQIVGRFAVCPEHGPVPVTGVASPPAPGSAPAGGPAMPDLAALPSLLALPLTEYARELNPVLALWHAADAVELTLRFVVTAGLAELASGGPLDPALLSELRPRIDAPTLGKWRGMAEAVVRHLPQEGALLPELATLVGDALVPLLDGDSDTRSAETSFAALRNQLAHGGGVTRAVAARLLETWRPRLQSFTEALAWTERLDLVVRTGHGGLGNLRGPEAKPQEYCPAAGVASRLEDAFVSGEEVVLVRGERVLTLWPLALYGSPRVPDPDAVPPDEVVPQVYVRRGEVQLQLTPLGSEACAVAEGDDASLDAFRRLFRLDEAATEARQRKHAVRGFEAEIQRDADRLVGRSAELDTVRRLLADTSEGVLWLTGPAGIGKSYLVAEIAAELLDRPPAGTLVLPYRFKAGDDRCSCDAFLTFALERLGGWEGLPQDPDAEKDEQQKPLDRLKEVLSSLGEARVLFILDGLDEVAGRDPRFAEEVPLALAGPGVLWLCAGRPEGGLPEAFAPERCTHVFPDGVPAMGSGDVRTMLLEKIGPLRTRLVARDREDGGTVTNAFVGKVAACAGGLPLYVTYVVGDILSNRLRALDAGERLPPSLDRYHEELLKRCAVGILHQVVTPLVATLAVAREPLAPEALADLLERGNVLPDEGGALPLVRRALGAVGSMIRRATTPEGGEGYTLFHHSLRQHMEASPEMAPAQATARRNLCSLAESPGGGEHAASRYLYRHGVAHLLEAGRRDEALALLISFAYLMERMQQLEDLEAANGVLADWLAATPGPLTDEQRLWGAFVRERAHILRRGSPDWPAYKILLQLAVEHADDSPVTRQAEAWLEEGHCDWLWLREARRCAHAAPSACLSVLEGHSGSVTGALKLNDGRILSWSDDSTLRLWGGISGAPLATLEGHSGSVKGAWALPDGRILSWSGDHTLRLWDGGSGTPLATLEGHSDSVIGATALPDGRILSWSWDQTLRLWDADTGAPLATLEGHSSLVDGATVLPDGRILSWSADDTLRLWDGDTGAPLATLEGHSGTVRGATVLSDGRILSWSKDHTLRLWDGATGASLATLEGHSRSVDGATVLSDGRILSWSSDHTLRLWDGDTGTPLASLEGHSRWGGVKGATVLSDGRILSWSDDHTLRLWDGDTGTPLASLEGHSRWGGVKGVTVLSDGRILSWSDDHTLRLWDGGTGTPLATLEGHSGTVWGATILSDGRILSWSWDQTLRLWDGGSGTPFATLEGHSDSVIGATVLPDGRILSWSVDGTLRLWDGDTGAALATLQGHSSLVYGATVLPDGRILSWSWDQTLRLWDGTTGASLANFEGHLGWISDAIVLPDGRILSWSDDDTLRLWDGDTGAPLATLEGHSGEVSGATILSDGRILSWSYDDTLRLWDGHSGAQLATLEGHSRSVDGATVLSDGCILSWSDDSTLRLWDGISGAPLATLEGHSGSVKGAWALPDGRILSWSGDHTLRLWDGGSGTPLATLEGHSDSVIGATALPDGRILSWSWDQTLRLWDGRSGAPLGRWLVQEAFRDAPTLWAAYARAANADCAADDGVAGCVGPAVICLIAEEPAIWHAAGGYQARAFAPNGLLVATCGRHLAIVHLCHGARRVSIAEASSIVHTEQRHEEGHLDKQPRPMLPERR